MFTWACIGKIRRFYISKVLEIILTRGPWATSLTWETVPINKHICAKLCLLIKKTHIFLFETYVKTKVPVNQGCFVQFSWYWPSGSGEEDFKISCNFFVHLLSYPLGKDISLHFNKLEFPSTNDALGQVWLKLVQ